MTVQAPIGRVRHAVRGPGILRPEHLGAALAAGLRSDQYVVHGDMLRDRCALWRRCLPEGSLFALTGADADFFGVFLHVRRGTAVALLRDASAGVSLSCDNC
jgi:hypothetical protein